MSLPILGIDIAKAKFDVALYQNGQYKHKVFENKKNGFKQLQTWLSEQGIEKVHACMEATGALWDDLAVFMHEHSHDVSVVNPLQIKRFGEAELSRTKNDKADSKLIARYCERMKPQPWEPISKAREELRALVRRREALVNMKIQERNREDQSNSAVQQSIKSLITFIEAEITRIDELIKSHIDNDSVLKSQKDLLKSIPGIGDTTASVVLAELPGIEKFEKVNKLVAFVGLSPREHSSGSSVRGKPTISKVGNFRLRKALYMPALIAKFRNPAVHALCERLEAKGKSSKTIICACMTKLLHIIFGVLKTQTPFDPMLHLV